MGCYNSAVIAAPVDQVWATIRDFHDLSWAPGVVTSVAKVGDAAGDQIGARRILNDGFHETLVTLDDAERIFSYSIDDGPGPVARGKVTGYLGSVRVAPVTVGSGGTFVEWSSRWESSQGGVTEFCDPIYRALLGALQQHFA